MKKIFRIQAMGLPVLVGSLCAVSAFGATPAEPGNSLKPCLTSESSSRDAQDAKAIKDAKNLTDSIETIDLAKIPMSRRCKSPSTYVEIIIGNDISSSFCTASKGLLPAVSKSGHLPNSGYRLHLSDYLEKRSSQKIRDYVKQLNLEAKQKKDELQKLSDEWNNEVRGADGMLHVGAAYALAAKIPPQYRSQDGKKLNILDSIAKYRQSLKQDIDDIKQEIEGYSKEKVAEKVSDAAEHFSNLAVAVLLDCPATGYFMNPIHACTPAINQSKAQASKQISGADAFASELTQIRAHDEALRGTPLEELRIESLFQQGNLRNPEKGFLACNEFFQTFGVTRFGCEQAGGDPMCHILAEGAAAISGKRVKNPDEYKTFIFGRLADVRSTEQEFSSQAKGGEMTFGGDTTQPADAAGAAKAR